MYSAQEYKKLRERADELWDRLLVMAASTGKPVDTWHEFPDWSQYKKASDKANRYYAEWQEHNRLHKDMDTVFCPECGKRIKY